MKESLKGIARAILTQQEKKHAELAKHVSTPKEKSLTTRRKRNASLLKEALKT